MQGIRRKSRTTALQILYQHEVNPVPPEQALERLLQVEQVPDKARAYALALVKATLDNMEAIDQRLTQALEHWKLSRLPVVVRHILRMSVCEMLLMEGTPFQVVVNEAVETARKYMDESSAKFVNGVLERCWINDGRELPAGRKAVIQDLVALAPAEEITLPADATIEPTEPETD